MKLIGDWISFELAKDVYNIEPFMINPDCIDWDKRKIFIGRIID